MISSTEQIKVGIALNMTDRISGMQVLPYVRDQVLPPAADIRRGPMEYDQSMVGGIHRLTILVRVFVASVMDKSAQAQLDSYLAPDGDNSIKAAIESDRSLGGLIDDLHVTGATGEQAYTMGQVQMTGSEWTVEIWL